MKAIQLKEFSYLDFRGKEQENTHTNTHTETHIQVQPYICTEAARAQALPFSSCKFCKSKAAQSFDGNKNLNSLIVPFHYTHLSCESIPFEHPSNQQC